MTNPYQTSHVGGDRKRRRTWHWIALLIGTVCLIGCSGIILLAFFFYFSLRASAEPHVFELF